MGLKGLNELPFSFENTSSDPFIFPNCTKLNSLDIPASTNQCQGLLDMHTQLRPTKQIIDSLVEIKYTLSLLQVSLNFDDTRKFGVKNVSVLVVSMYVNSSLRVICK